VKRYHIYGRFVKGVSNLYDWRTNKREALMLAKQWNAIIYCENPGQKWELVADFRR